MDLCLRDELIKIVIDKGILVILAVVVTANFAKSLEHFKSGLSWGAELLKQRLAIARELLKAMDSVEYNYRKLLASTISQASDANENLNKFMDATETLKTTTNEAGLLLSASAFESAKAFNSRAISLLGRLEDFKGNSRAGKAVQDDLADMRLLLEKAIGSLQKEFPKGALPVDPTDA